MALPYKVIVQVVKYGKCYDEREKKTTVDCKVVGINRYTLITDKDSVEHTYAKGYVSTPITVPIDDGDMKSLPYLRPLSSMTKEEDEKRIQLGIWRSSQINGCEVTRIVPDTSFEIYNSQPFQNALNFLLRGHFDIFGLIPKGLAIEITEDNNPYKNNH